MKRLLTCFLFVLCLLPVQSYASTTGGVSSAKVTEGALSTEFRVGYSAGDDQSSQDQRLRTREHIDYGFTPWYALRLIVAQDKRKGDSFEHDNIEFLNRFYLLQAKDYGFDFGMRLSYQLKDGDKKPDSAEVQLIEVVPVDGFELRLNQKFSHDVGQGSSGGVGFEHRAQATFKISDTQRLGIESYNDFGDLRDVSSIDGQSHTIGPVLKGKFMGVGYETGYRAGIAKGSIEHSFKLFLSKSF